MSSFYGGKEGRTYNIVQRYDSVAQMVEAFSQGGAYTGANYGQYVIIDTVLNSSRSNRENGLLYRRGFDYNQTIETIPVKQNTETDEEFQERWINYIENPGAGAIYVGQIVGPEGRTPEVSIQQWSNFLEQFDEQGTGAYGAASKIVLEQTTTGKTDDEIKVGYVNIRDAHGDTTGGYIAIDIPKLVVEAEVVDHNAYSTAGVVEDSGSANHPLWYKWNFTVPDGKRGADLNGLSVETGEETGEDEDAEGNPIVSGDEYLTYSIKDYTDNAAGAITAHLGRWPYRVINQITLNPEESRTSVTWENGTYVQVGQLYFTSEYPENLYWMCIKEGNIVIDEQIGFDSLDDITEQTQIGTETTDLQETKWRVVNIPETAPAHSLYIDYTAGQNDQFENKLRSIDYLSVDDSGNLFAFYSDLEDSYYLTNIGGLRSNDGIELTNDAVKFIYTNGTEREFPLKQILSIDFNTGNPTKDQYDEWVLDEEGRPVFDSEGQDSNLKIRYKDGTITSFEVKRLDSITYDNTNINAAQYIIAHYLGGTDENITDSPINLVIAMDRIGDNIIILHSDPETRARIQQQGEEGIDWVKRDWTNYTGDNAPVWQIIGSTNGKYHVQGEYHYADLKGDPTYSDYDADTYIDLSNGFQGELLDRQGWLVTVTDSGGVRHIYAFDYNDILKTPPTYQIGNEGNTFYSHWYELTSIASEDIKPNLFVVVQQNQPTGATLKDDMLWFVESYGHDNY